MVALEQDPATADAFLSHPFWRSEYVGLGPYRLTHWEPGSQFEGVAFDGYVLGRPKIDRIVIRVVGDDTVILTNILAGALDWAELRLEGGRLLERDWVPAGKGNVDWIRGNGQFLVMQLRPEYAGSPAQLDIRVRRAMAHSLDRPGIDDGVFDGQGFITETIVPVTESFYPEIDRVIARYPYDPGFYLYFGKECHAYPSSLHGPQSETTAIGSFTQRTVRNYNIHEWEWR